MNYGRFFRLNQTLSNVVDGIAVYDYIDLPAYFGPSVDNHMSPKYPLSVTITPDSVCFRLHYGAFKIENVKEKELGPRYAYSKGDLEIKAFPIDGYDNPNKISMAHMEEVILELPYTNNVTKELSDTIKKIYVSKFPLQEYENNGELEKVSYGGRFLEQLINKRYPKSSEWKSLKKLSEEGNIEAFMYGTLREVSDDSPSYSTLWLMDLMCDVKVECKKRRIHLYDKKEVSVVAFLRKLLLDFMFDLKHSDVFQNSANYQMMYSSLMSDFFFSALMHKCEYYYYRKLTREVINEIENDNDIEENREKRKDAVKTLYANELVKAEDLWIQDIMNPQAEKEFEHRYPDKRKLLWDIFERYRFLQWPSWFAEPEEEMRRVCFTMEEDSGEKHLCNADILIEYLKIGNGKDKISASLVATNDRNRELISRWFLKRYDFNDVINLHFFKYLNVLLVITILLLFVWLFGLETLNLTEGEALFSDIAFVLKPAHIFLGFLACPILGTIVLNYASEKEWAIKTRFELAFKRTTAIFFLFLFFIASTLVLEAYLNTVLAVLLSLVLTCGIHYILSERLNYFPALHPISSLHLLFPRLVAAVTAGWLTMSLGFDIYVSFFDSIPRWHTAIAISGVVFMFIMYEINRIMPASNDLRKLFRSFEFLIISYCISLLVGVVVINFVGEKFLERGGYIGDYYEQHVDNNKRVVDTIAYNSNANGEILNDSQWVTYGKAVINRLNDIKDPNDIPDIKKVENLQEVTKDGHKIVEKKNILGFEIYFMRDFLIMFSFIAMFWGIFIQMIFTGEKQMTEL